MKNTILSFLILFVAGVTKAQYVSKPAGKDTAVTIRQSKAGRVEVTITRTVKLIDTTGQSNKSHRVNGMQQKRILDSYTETYPATTADSIAGVTNFKRNKGYK